MVISKRAFVVSLVFFSLNIKGSGQDRQVPLLFDSLLRQGESLMYSDFGATDLHYREAERLILEFGIAREPLRWVHLLHLRAGLYYYNGKYSLAKQFIDDAYAAIDRFRGQLQNPDSLVYNTSFFHALYLTDLARFDEALARLGAIEEYLEAQISSPPQCFRLYQTVQYQASIYALKGEYESAVNGYLSSLRYYDCYRDSNTYPNYVLTFRNIGDAYVGMNDFANAMRFYWKAKSNLDSCLAKLGEAKVKTHAMNLYYSIGELYNQKKKVDSARFYFEQAIPLIKENPLFAYRIYKGLANNAAQVGDHMRALEQYETVLDIVRERYGERHSFTADIYSQMSEIKQRAGDIDHALDDIQTALSCLTAMDWNRSDLHSNPPLQGAPSKKALTETLHQKARLQHHAYIITGNDQYLTGARETNLLAIQLLDSTRNEFTLEKDKVVLGEQAVRIFQTSIQIAFELYRQTHDDVFLSEVFELMDKSKSAVLLDHLKLVRNFSGIPAEVLERERQLKAELTIAEEELFKAESSQQNPARFRETLGDLKRDYAELFTDIKRSWPAYYNLRIANNAVSLRDVQTKLLQTGQAVIEYFPGDTTLYMVCVTRDSVWVNTSEAHHLHEEVLALRELLIAPGADSKALQRMTAALYEKLIAPWAHHLDTTIRSLIIIPQGVLTYLPIEMLYPAGHSPMFMLDRFAVSYASSASLLWEQKQMEVSGNAFAGFNADYSAYETLPPLMGSRNEIEAIREIFGGSSDVFANATADDFREAAPGYKVLHLALHSYIDDERPLFSRLVFTASEEGHSEITANELYAMQLNADLAVLSACESGVGQLHRGEGMMSLSRAFMYAGVPSTLFSLWKVPDQATSRLMTKFYTFLEQGQARDVALANAKREFVNDYPEMSAPLFWAGFVINGKTDPLTSGVPLASPTILMLAIALLVVAIVLVIYISRRHRSKSVVR